ncbi:MAG: hypothetical protein ACR2O4_14725 [Hyphomicrobiaceae bacterium]
MVYSELVGTIRRYRENVRSVAIDWNGADFIENANDDASAPVTDHDPVEHPPCSEKEDHTLGDFFSHYMRTINRQAKCG